MHNRLFFFYPCSSLLIMVCRNDFGTDHRHHVHGGYSSFDRQNWETEINQEGDGVVFSLVLRVLMMSVMLVVQVSPDGCEGSPGKLLASVCYRLRHGSHLTIGNTQNPLQQQSDCVDCRDAGGD